MPKKPVKTKTPKVKSEAKPETQSVKLNAINLNTKILILHQKVTELETIFKDLLAVPGEKIPEGNGIARCADLALFKLEEFALWGYQAVMRQHPQSE